MKNRKYIQPVTKILKTEMHLKNTKDGAKEHESKKDSTNETFESFLQSEIMKTRKDKNIMIKIINDDYNQNIKNIQKQKEKTIGCRINVEDGLVKLSIPERVLYYTENDIPVKAEPCTLIFSKREIKELLQDLYVS